MRNVPHRDVEKTNTRILCSITFFIKNRADYEKMWKNIVWPDGSHMTIWRMRIACWVPKAKDTYSEYVILIDFPLQQLSQGRISMPYITYLSWYNMRLCYRRFATDRSLSTLPVPTKR